MPYPVLDAPISPLRQRLIDDMNMRRFSQETQRNYLRDIGRLATFLGRSPDTATTDDLRRFQIEQQDDGVPVPTVNSIVSALRFFFTHTVDRPDLARKLVRLAQAQSCRSERWGLRRFTLYPSAGARRSMLPSLLKIRSPVPLCA
ncbi:MULTISPECIES: site-specific integrase [unclassified Mesorhizobium]|uniref:site-specific integrase n=1 Tax=unclassified Mesorhizobium TaxID=325217 RepID=UPI001FDF7E57|nr:MULTISPECIES: site-specific integrase [unclassified Mesorhizobium]